MNSPSIDQIISQASTKMMNNTQPIDFESLFGGDFNDYEHTITTSSSDKSLMNASIKNNMMTTDALLHSLIHDSSSSSIHLQDFTPSPIMNTPCLDALNTPFTPATGFHSPMMATPYMDPLIGHHFQTPYMDASSTPFMNTTTSLNGGFDSNDCLEQYFTPMIGNQNDNDLLSVDPSQISLGMDSITTPHSSTMSTMNNNNNTITTKLDNDDSLFPPLNEEQEQQLKLMSSTSLSSSTTMTTTTNNNDNNNNTDEFHNKLDDLFDDFFGQNNNEKEQQPSTMIGQKRKLNHDETLITNVNKIAKEDESKAYVCDICHRGFSRRYNLGTHIKTHDKNRVKPFACYLCPKSFDRKHDCERHISTVHMGERLFTCTPCNISFSRRDALHRHQAQKHSSV
ncbi:unnamed protein product [Cunninghamella blakesleeana]